MYWTMDLSRKKTPKKLRTQKRKKVKMIGIRTTAQKSATRATEENFIFAMLLWTVEEQLFAFWHSPPPIYILFGDVYVNSLMIHCFVVRFKVVPPIDDNNIAIHLICHLIVLLIIDFRLFYSNDYLYFTICCIESYKLMCFMMNVMHKKNNTNNRQPIFDKLWYHPLWAHSSSCCLFLKCVTIFRGFFHVRKVSFYKGNNWKQWSATKIFFSTTKKQNKTA